MDGRIENPGSCRRREPGSFTGRTQNARANLYWPRDRWLPGSRQEQPLVDPQVVHFMHVPLRTRVKLPHSPQASPS